MITYKDISEARELLQLPERASLKEIKTNYRRLITRWHPDTCKDESGKCTEMTQKLNSAYKIIMLYCNQYQYSFAKEEVERYMSAEDWWYKRFGNDPLWGSTKKR